MIKTLLFTLSLLPFAANAADLANPAESAEPQKVVISAQRDPEWASYRHAYKAVAFFASFTHSRPLIQAHMQIRALQKDASLEGLHLQLIGKTTHLDIDVDNIGRATIPLQKAAYEEDAVLRLNREKGIYYFSGRYSIKEREDGVYQIADLRAACDQLLSAQKDSGYWLRLIGKKCKGIKFVYASSASDASVDFQDTAKLSTAIKAVDDHPFEDKSMAMYKVAIYRFSDWPEQGEIITKMRPIAIGTAYD